jgi:hypothetical protein
VIVSIVLLLILVALIAINIQLHELVRISKKQDFTTEDAQVKAMTEQVAEAARRLPKQEK